MKVAFDENVPVQMVRVFKALGQERRFRKDGLEFFSATEYTPKPSDQDYIRKSDVPWLTRFGKDGGKVVISGNTRMMDVPLEMQALRQHSFRVFFFERAWNHWDFHEKIALLMFHWPAIIAKIKTAKAGDFWCVPNHFRTDGGLRNVTPGAKQIQKTNPRAAGREVQASGKGPGRELDGSGVRPDGPSRHKGRRRPEQDSRQSPLPLVGGGLRRRPEPPPDQTE